MKPPVSNVVEFWNLSRHCCSTNGLLYFAKVIGAPYLNLWCFPNTVIGRKCAPCLHPPSMEFVNDNIILDLVNVPFCGFWTSLSSIYCILYPQYLGDVKNQDIYIHLPNPLVRPAISHHFPPLFSGSSDPPPTCLWRHRYLKERNPGSSEILLGEWWFSWITSPFVHMSPAMYSYIYIYMISWHSSWLWLGSWLL